MYSPPPDYSCDYLQPQNHNHNPACRSQLKNISVKKPPVHPSQIQFESPLPPLALHPNPPFNVSSANRHSPIIRPDGNHNTTTTTTTTTTTHTTNSTTTKNPVPEPLRLPDIQSGSFDHYTDDFDCLSDSDDVIPFPEKVPVLGPPTPPPDYDDQYGVFGGDNHNDDSDDDDESTLFSPSSNYTYKFHYEPLTMNSLATTKTTRSTNLASAFLPLRPFNPDNDAGNKPQDHYKSRLAPWRYYLRCCLLPLVRWETPYLAAMQQRLRSPALDLYFAMSANLGTHTFYVTCLPMMFWLGLTDLGRGFVFVLAFGVYITGFIKDLLCLPRPLSPPLHRITMSGSAALEYGFPSTHTANAVSVFLLVSSHLYSARAMASSSVHGSSSTLFMSPSTYTWLQLANVVYVVSIVLGRLYCGMHGFLDVLCGAFIGVFLWAFRLKYGAWMDAIATNTNSYAVLLVIPIILILVRIHPEPIDNCPCFEDGVSFMGVQLGVVVGDWLIAKYFMYPDSNGLLSCPGCIPFGGASAGVYRILLRFIIGVSLVAVWRHNAKKIFHTVLPPLFRIAERLGLLMPRRFFVPASQYDGVPDPLPESTFQTGEKMKINNLFRVRSDSVGPQSTADVYESIAYREYQRQRGQLSTSQAGSSCSSCSSSCATVGVGPVGVSPAGAAAAASTNALPSSASSTAHKSGAGSKKKDPYDEDEDTLLSKIPAPRVKYDVEVVTRLIVYAGVAMMATTACAPIFAMLDI